MDSNRSAFLAIGMSNNRGMSLSLKCLESNEGGGLRIQPDTTPYSLQGRNPNPFQLSVMTTDDYEPIVDEVMAVYWVADDFTGVVVVPPGASLRLTVVKLGEEVVGKGKILGIVRGMNGKFDSIEQLTVGENFSPGMSKGFSIASIAIINCVGCELD
ncbi:hypothetical protein SASPL_111240 [Salvia splendens]|uniref:Uncharacterized protein n=1 Tax=Salvia splendens TaxID=180675 RepID=A0A8X9A444_SALSN|nr:hypothetical protein SASPL_111240 [Salvia splendens]